LSQQWQCLDAVTTLREIHCSIRLRPGSLRSWFGGGLRKSDSGGNQETRIQKRKGKGTQQSWGNDAHSPIICRNHHAPNPNGIWRFITSNRRKITSGKTNGRRQGSACRHYNRR